MSESLVDKAVCWLTEEIIANRIKPGRKISETQLAKQFAEVTPSGSVSRTPVKIALATLAATGLIEHTTNKGSRVRELTIDEMHQVLITRFCNESFFARNLAERLQPQNTQTLRDSLNEMSKIIEGIPQASTEHEHELRLRFAIEDISFHSSFALSCGVDVAAEFIRRLIRIIVVNTIATHPLQQSEAQAVLDEHSEITVAIESKNTDAINEAVRRHLNHTKRRWSASSEFESFVP